VKLLSDCALVPDMSDCLQNKSADMDVVQETPLMGGNETNKSSNRIKKFPTSRYSDFLWDI